MKRKRKDEPAAKLKRKQARARSKKAKGKSQKTEQELPLCTRENAVAMAWRIACRLEVLKPKTALSALKLVGDWERWKKPAPVNAIGGGEKTALQVWIEKNRVTVSMPAPAAGSGDPGAGPGPVQS